jgi:hypothetical protein
MKETIFNFTETSLFKSIYLITAISNMLLIVLTILQIIPVFIFPIWFMLAVVILTLHSYNGFVLAKQELAKGNLDINYWSISNFHILLIITPLVFIINIVGLFL